jgi:tetratricopeptide (TPR) repeat protein
MTDNAVVNESRLYNRKYHRYEGNIHEQITPLDKHPKIVKAAPIVLAHYGYLPDVKTAKSKYERNARLLEEALSKKPNDPYIQFQLGKCYSVNNGDLEKACGYFEKALSAKEDPRLEYVYYTVELYGYALINTGQYEKALELSSDYWDYYNSKPEFRFLSAHIYQNNGLLQEAVDCYESCIGADTYDPKGITSYLSYYNIGVILECVGMVEDAVKMYKNCKDYEPAKKRLTEIV